MRRIVLWLALRRERGRPAGLGFEARSLRYQEGYQEGVVRHAGPLRVAVETESGDLLTLPTASLRWVVAGPFLRLRFLRAQLDVKRRATELGDEIASAIADQPPADPPSANVASFPPRPRPVPAGPDLPPGAA